MARAGKPCGRLGCPVIVQAGVTYCTTHAREYEQRRGTKRQRGYTSDHDQQARAWRARVARGEHVTCWRCLQPITDPADCDLGHDDHDRTITRGPEHAGACNRAAAGRSAHA